MITKDDIDKYLQIRNELNELCEKYAKKYLKEYWHYSNWSLLSNDYIEIEYWHYIECDPYYGRDKEYLSTIIPIDYFFEQCKELL